MCDEVVHSTSMGSQVKISGIAFKDEPSMKANMAVNSFPREGKTRGEKYAFCLFNGRDMLMSLKDLALEPWKSSHQRLWNQMLKVRKLLNVGAERPQRKRKLNQYENDSKLAASIGLISREKYGNQNAKNQRRHGSSSLSRSPLPKEKRGSLQGKREHIDFPVLNERAEYCSLSSQDYSPLSDRIEYCGLSTQDYSNLSASAEQLGSLQGTQENVALPALNDRAEYCCVCRQDYSHLSDGAEQLGSLQGTQGNVALPALDGRAEYCCVCRQDYSHLSDSDESIKGLKPMNQGNLKSHCIDLVTDSCTHSTETSIYEETTAASVNVLKSSVNEGFDDSSGASNSLSSGKEGMELTHPRKEILPSRIVHYPRLAIPIGPRFQAEVPAWEGTTNVEHYNGGDLKWLGTQIWPKPGIKVTNTKRIGKGRSDSCSCDIPGSVDCVLRHISEARKLLQSEIGTAFYSWKFDGMGEDVSKSWTLKEQKEFESLIKLNPLSDDTDFWKLAMEHFPAKSMLSMVSYYYNVYIPRRMSKETRSSFGALDSDTDQNDNDKNDDCSTTPTHIVPIFKLFKSRIKTTR